MKHIFLNLKRFDIPREYGGSTVWRPWRNGEAILFRTPRKS